MCERGQGDGPGSEEDRGEEPDDLVDHPRVEEGCGQCRAALDETVLHVGGSESREEGIDAVLANEQGLGGPVEDARPGGQASGAHDHPQRLAGAGPALLVARGQPRVVDQCGAGADDHCVDDAPQRLGAGTGGCAGDSSRAAGGIRHAAVQARRALQRHQGSAVGLDVLPGPVRPRGLGRADSLDHLDAGGAEHVAAALRLGGGIGPGEHDARDAGLDQCLGARAGAPRVTARLEGDDGGATASQVAGVGEGDGLGVRRAGSPVVPAPDQSPVRIDDDAADSGIGRTLDVRAGREFDGLPHEGRPWPARLLPA